ncbi:MAG: HAD-IIB family hydrolase [Nitrospiraceae bacterium]|nr:MAG: HAD-IIB family hydrolase [Nitrospiraceae bacterium]
MNILFFTDLDGTLLDSRYSFRKAVPALKRIRNLAIPLVLCSSKTAAEIEVIRKRIGNHDPFVSENGGGIFIPEEAGLKVRKSQFHVMKEGSYSVIKLGASYSDLRKALSDLRSKGVAVRGFGDMTAREVAGLTGLRLSDARLAKQRHFDEPFVFEGSPRTAAALLRQIRAQGLRHTRGEFFHLMGDSDKGKAVEIVKSLYLKGHGALITAALGDSPNDIEMLLQVDYPVVVKKENGRYHPEVVKRVPGLIRARGAGPEGWNRAVNELLEALLL